jgi:hypothetical protein
MHKITLKQICERLNVTEPWVDKAITKLKFHRKGRGSKRIFTMLEYEKIRNVKVLRICGISWRKIERLQRGLPEEQYDLFYREIYNAAKKNNNVLNVFIKSPHPTLP